jgi:hypothetical protein
MRRRKTRISYYGKNDVGRAGIEYMVDRGYELSSWKIFGYLSRSKIDTL